MRGVAVLRKLALLLVAALALFGSGPLRACAMTSGAAAAVGKVPAPVLAQAPCAAARAGGPMTCCSSHTRSETKVAGDTLRSRERCQCSLRPDPLSPARESVAVATVVATLPSALAVSSARSTVAAVLTVLARRSASRPDPPPRPDRGRAPPGVFA